MAANNGTTTAQPVQKKMNGYFEGKEIGSGKPDLFQIMSTRKYGDSTIITEFSCCRAGTIFRDIVQSDGKVVSVTTTFVPVQVTEKEDGQTKKKHFMYSI
jgi:hypothetical protein